MAELFAVFVLLHVSVGLADRFNEAVSQISLFQLECKESYFRDESSVDYTTGYRLADDALCLNSNGIRSGTASTFSLTTNSSIRALKESLGNTSNGYSFEFWATLDEDFLDDVFVSVSLSDFKVIVAVSC